MTQPQQFNDTDDSQEASRQRAVLYAAAALVIANEMHQHALTLGMFSKYRTLTTAQWLNLLQITWPAVQAGRQQTAVLARAYYDAELASHGYRHDVGLVGSDFGHYVTSMEQARSMMSKADTPSNGLNLFGAVASRAVENAGREQIVMAVEDSAQVIPFRPRESPLESDLGTKNEVSGVIRGWARVAQGHNPCAFCLMLVSRGPVYSSAQTAGLDLSDQSALDGDEDVSSLMKQWHPNCHCIVVPVFKGVTWFGLKAQRDAESLWIEASKQVDNTDLGTIRSGPDKGKPMTKNQATLNALRQIIQERGLKMEDFAGLAA